MESKDFKKKAAKILAANPTQKEVFITADGQAFFEKPKAVYHCRHKGIEQEPEVFFRDGYTPEAETDVQALLETENESLTDALKEAKEENESLTAKFEASEKENTQLKADLKTAHDGFNGLQDAFNKQATELDLIKKVADPATPVTGLEKPAVSIAADTVFELRNSFDALVNKVPAKEEPAAEPVKEPAKAKKQ